MSHDDETNFVTQAQFARMRGVTRRAVTGWKHRGLVVLNDAGLVDVAQSNARLLDRPVRERLTPVRPADKSAALSESLREGARVIVEMLPTFIAGVEAFARVFDVAAAAVAHLDPQSFAIARALHEIAEKLPTPASEVASDLRRVADQIDAGSIRVN